MYILNLLSKSPETGFSIIQKIEERTEGAWRPGPGAMYPLLTSLTREGLIRPAHEVSGRSGKTYTLTAKGRKSLAQMKSSFGSMGRKEPVMARLFSDLVPDEAFVMMVLRRQRDFSGILKEKVAGIAEGERTQLLKELKLQTEGQLRWIESMLSGSKAGRKP